MAERADCGAAASPRARPAGHAPAPATPARGPAAGGPGAGGPGGRARAAGCRRRMAPAAAAVLLALPAAAAEPIAVPSGQTVTLLQHFVEPQAGTGEVWARFRYLAPAIAPGEAAVPYRQARIDMAHLCDHHALPVLAGRGPAPDLIVISLSSSTTGFGETAPEVTQYFETFSVAGDRCRLEVF